MLIIDDNSVYEIDEECMRKQKVPKECKTYEKIQKKEDKVIKSKERRNR